MRRWVRSINIYKKLPGFPALLDHRIRPWSQEWHEVQHLRSTCHPDSVHGVRNVVLRFRGFSGRRPILTHPLDIETLELSLLHKLKPFLVCSRALNANFRY